MKANDDLPLRPDHKYCLFFVIALFFCVNSSVAQEYKGITSEMFTAMDWETLSDTPDENFFTALADKAAGFTSGDCRITICAKVPKDFKNPAGTKVIRDIPLCCMPTAAEDKEILALFALINAYRKSKGIPELGWSNSLQEAAQGHARHMKLAEFFAHDYPYVTQIQTCIARGNACGEKTQFIGENLHKGTTTAAGPFNGWKKSDGHNKNLLNKDYKSIGIGFHDKYWAAKFSDKL